RVRRPTLFSLWRKARRENSAASRLLGSTSLRFALHGWQRKCQRDGQVLYADRPCPEGIEMRTDPAPPRPERQPHRLVIEHKHTTQGPRYNSHQRSRLYATVQKLKQQSTLLRSRIHALQQQKERELQHQALGDPQRLTTINLYWNSKIDAMEREYDRNLQQIYRLEDMAGQ
ncbi:hypothetical protein, partial [Thiolapillus sp.]